MPSNYFTPPTPTPAPTTPPPTEPVYVNGNPYGISGMVGYLKVADAERKYFTQTLPEYRMQLFKYNEQVANAAYTRGKWGNSVRRAQPDQTASLNASQLQHEANFRAETAGADAEGAIRAAVAARRLARKPSTIQRFLKGLL